MLCCIRSILFSQKPRSSVFLSPHRILYKCVFPWAAQMDKFLYSANHWIARYQITTWSSWRIRGCGLKTDVYESLTLRNSCIYLYGQDDTLNSHQCSRNYNITAHHIIWLSVGVLACINLQTSFRSLSDIVRVITCEISRK